jgi:hypothetical protein
MSRISQEDTASRWIERGRKNAEAWLSAREPRVELGSERDGPEPFPASMVAHALTNSPSIVRLSERADDLSRARNLAASRGLAGTDDALLAMLFRP